MNPVDLRTFLCCAIPLRENVLITSAPGIGKTEICQQVYEYLNTNKVRHSSQLSTENNDGWEMFTFHPVVDDPTDYKGFPFVIEQNAKFIPFTNLKRIIEATRPTLILFDDMGQACAAVQAALMQIVQTREINGMAISPLVSFVACTNRKGDKAGVQGIIEPLKSRFTIVELTVSVEDWSSWAAKNNVSPDMIAFINISERSGNSMLHNFKPTMEIFNSPCPRNVVRADAWMQRQELPLSIRYEAVKGRCGEAFMIAWKAFLEILSKLPSPQEVISNPMGVNISDLGPSQMFALCGAAAFRAKESNFGKILEFAGRLHDEYKTLMVTDITGRLPELKNTMAYTKWASEHARRI